MSAIFPPLQRGATASLAGRPGLAPRPAAGDELKVLRGDSTYQLGTEGGLTYKGTWNASTNTPTLADGSGTVGDAYYVETGASRNLGSGSITFAQGDWVAYNGSIWQKRSGIERWGTTTLSAISAAGNTDVTITAGVRNQSVIAPISAGSAAYVATISLLATNAIAGTIAEVRVAMPASTNPYVTVRDLTSSGTVLLTLQGGAAARTYWVRARFDGTNWTPIGSGCLRAASIDEVMDIGNTRAPADYLQSDGATTNRRIETVYGAVGAVAGSDFTFVSEPFYVPTSNPSADAVVFRIGVSATAGVTEANAIVCFFESGSAALKVVANGAAGGSTDYRRFSHSTFRSTYSGQYGRLIVAFSGDSTTSPTIYWQGVDISSAFAITSAGTVPNWIATALSTTYFVQGLNWPSGYFRPGTPVNRKYAQADVDFVQTTGRLPAADALGGSMVTNITGDNSTFASDTGYWSKTGSATISAGSCSLPSSSDWISRALLLTVGRRYRVTLINTAGSGNVQVFIGDGGQVNAAYGASVVVEGVCATSGTLTIKTTASLTIDTITLNDVGALSSPTIQPIQVVADATPNGIGSLVVGFTPVTSRRVWVIQDRTSTSGNEQILGGSVFANASRDRIDSWVINNAGTSKTVSLGNASAGTQFASGITAGAGLSDTTLATRFPGTTNLWVNSNGTDVLTHTIRGHRVD